VPDLRRICFFLLNREAIISAYIAGRGNANLHIVSFGVNPLTVPVGDATRNVVGGYTPHTSRDRAVDADNILNSFLGTDVKKYNRLFVRLLAAFPPSPPSLALVLFLTLRSALADG
tara:strand:+ start:407 stop:754 length:348 start_codon:yes stop_codon:yes gene_type:complete